MSRVGGLRFFLLLHFGFTGQGRRRRNRLSCLCRLAPHSPGATAV